MSYSTLRKILYIETGIDEKAGGKKLEQICAPLPDTVAFTVVTNAFIALECTEHTCYDAIIAKEELSDLQAIDLLEILHKVGANTPFILLTDRDNPVARRENKNYVQQDGQQDSYAIDGRFFSSLAKPYSASELCRTLQEVFDYDADNTSSDTETDTGSSGENIRQMDEIRSRAESTHGSQRKSSVPQVPRQSAEVERTFSGEIDDFGTSTNNFCDESDTASSRQVPLHTLQQQSQQRGRSGSHSSYSGVESLLSMSSAEENGLLSRGHGNPSHRQMAPKVQQPRATVPEKQPVVVHRPKAQSAKRGEKPLLNQLFSHKSSAQQLSSTSSRGAYYDQQQFDQQQLDPSRQGLRELLQLGQPDSDDRDDRSPRSKQVHAAPSVSENSSPRYFHPGTQLMPERSNLSDDTFGRTIQTCFRNGNKEATYSQYAKSVINEGPGSSRNVSRSNSMDSHCSDKSATSILSSLRIAAAVLDDTRSGGNGLYRSMSGNNLYGCEIRAADTALGFCLTEQLPQSQHPLPTFTQQDLDSVSNSNKFDLLNRAAVARSYSADQAEQRPFSSSDNFKPPVVQRTDSSGSNTSTESGSTRTSNKRRN